MVKINGMYISISKLALLDCEHSMSGDDIYEIHSLFNEDMHRGEHKYETFDCVRFSNLNVAWVCMCLINCFFLNKIQ